MMKKTDVDGVTFEQALQSCGYEGDTSNRLTEASAFVELHIEQGPILEREAKSIGVVECVLGMVCYEIEVTGGIRPRRDDADGHAERCAFCSQ